MSNHKNNNSHHADELRHIVKGQVKADKLSCAMYSTDAGIYQIEPLCVVMPADEDDIAKVVAYAAENKISVVPRGGGSGLAGECLGEGIILDMSRFMNQILDINREAGEVTVQPGVVLEQLNQRLVAVGMKIGPDPASGNRATIGGMIGNNATGARSIKYGYTGDYVRSLRVISAVGERLEFACSAPGVNETGLVEQLGRSVYELLKKNQELMARVRPRSGRNGSGYNVYSVLEDGQVNLAQLLAGSEGTLAIVSRAVLRMVPLPAVKVLLQVNFSSLGAMARAVPKILEHRPSACELLDGGILELARRAYPQYSDVLPSGVAASLLVEFDGDNEASVLARMGQARLMLEGLSSSAGCMGTKEIIDPAIQTRIWTARKATTPLLFREKNASQPIPIIEDVAVNPEQLAEYLEGLEAITQRLGVPVAYFAHAGDGELHPRPYLDLHKPEDVKKLCRLADEVFNLTWSLGGTISGEHGEGLARVSFIEKQYGPEMYEVFREIKRIFDPESTLNPGKIINDDPDVLTKNLRFSHLPDQKDRGTNLIFRDDEFVREIEQCNGNGLCRSFDPDLTMCPIFRATGDEDASPRAKGNLMRYWLTGLLDDDIMLTDEFKRIADLCVNCKMCALQCPSLVNIPKLMMEARAEYVKAQGLTRAQFALTRSEFMSRMGATFGPIANIFLQANWFRWIMEKVLQLDRRRAMPKFDWGRNIGKLRRYLSKKPPLNNPVDKVVYFVDLYATYNDHELGRAVVDVLLLNNIEVMIPDQLGVSMPAISYGAIDYARKAVEYNVRNLAKAVRDGYKIVCSEPTAALCLKEEYLDLTDSKDAHLVAENTWEITDYLTGLHEKGQLNDNFKKLPIKLAYHKPCHYKALQIEKDSGFLLSLIDGVEIEELPNSCCGIAGTFGFQKKNYDLSMKAGEPMLGPLRESKAEFGLTECGTCKMQMELATNKKTLHPIKVLAASYGLLKITDVSP
jgi:FAD/FMN-containing dehydrogenase/Fe-S oxidoreductase